MDRKLLDDIRRGGSARYPDSDDRDRFLASLMLLFASRYALGRQSTAPGHVASYIEQYPDVLSSEHKAQLASEIRRAIDDGRAGDPRIDVLTWGRVLAVLEGE